MLSAVRVCSRTYFSCAQIWSGVWPNSNARRLIVPKDWLVKKLNNEKQKKKKKKEKSEEIHMEVSFGEHKPS